MRRLAIVTLALLLLLSSAPASGAQEDIYVARIVEGGCDEAGVSIAALSDGQLPGDEQAGSAAGRPAAYSFTTVDKPFAELTATEHAITSGAVCGEIGGPLNDAGALVIVLAGPDGDSGIAYINPNGADPTRTDVSVFLAADAAGLRSVDGAINPDDAIAQAEPPDEEPTLAGADETAEAAIERAIATKAAPTEPAERAQSAGAVAHSTSCADYTTFEWAQTVYESDPAQFAGLDADGDGLACPGLVNGIAPSIWASAVPPGSELVTLDRVIDGDTADFVLSDGTVGRVRFILVDTPETVDPNRPVGCYGAEASAFTSFLLTLPADIYLERDVSETDRFGRLLRYVWLDFGNGYVYLTSETIARSGYGQLSTFPPDVKYVDQVQAGVEFAQRHQLGLWGACESFGAPALDPLPVVAPTPTPMPPTPMPPTPIPPAPIATQPPAPPPSDCHPSYPSLCLPGFPDLDCGQIADRRFPVIPPDPHGFDGDFDGVGCESG